MLTGLLKLTWLEIKIFLREPLGVVGNVAMPVAVFVLLGRLFSGGRPSAPAGGGDLMFVALPVFGSLLIALGAVQSLVTIIAIYREGGILKRLRATPLRPQTILSAHVLVKLALTAVTMAVMVAAGRRYLPPGSDARVVSFTIALLVATLSVLSVGFIVASIVPTARFAQPVASLIFYPMLALAMVPASELPVPLQVVARLSPLTYAASLLRGVIGGEPWLAHAGDIAALAVVFAVCTAISARLFRWE
jgi:ABC-2 type transport system permease protein